MGVNMYVFYLIVMLILGVLFLLFLVNCHFYQLLHSFSSHSDICIFTPSGLFLFGMRGVFSGSDVMADIDWHLQRSIRGSEGEICVLCCRLVCWFGHAEGPRQITDNIPSTASHRPGGTRMAIMQQFSITSVTSLTLLIRPGHYNTIKAAHHPDSAFQN